MNFHETNMTFTDVESYKGEAMRGRDKTKGGKLVWLTFKKRQDNHLEDGWHEQFIKLGGQHHSY